MFFIIILIGYLASTVVITAFTKHFRSYKIIFQKDEIHIYMVKILISISMFITFLIQ